MKKYINDPNELLTTLESTVRKQINAIMVLNEHGIVNDETSKRLVKTENFVLALLLQLSDVLREKNNENQKQSDRQGN